MLVSVPVEAPGPFDFLLAPGDPFRALPQILFCHAPVATDNGQSDERSLMADDNTPITYRIKFEKDHASVKASYDLSVPIGDPALIAAFQISVAGADLISNFIPGQSGFNGAQFHTLPHPDQDATVSFSISSNQGWTASDTDVLRGNRTYDDAEFSA